MFSQFLKFCQKELYGQNFNLLKIFNRTNAIFRSIIENAANFRSLAKKLKSAQVDIFVQIYAFLSSKVSSNFKILAKNLKLF